MIINLHPILKNELEVVVYKQSLVSGERESFFSMVLVNIKRNKLTVIMCFIKNKILKISANKLDVRGKR